MSKEESLYRASGQGVGGVCVCFYWVLLNILQGSNMNSVIPEDVYKSKAVMLEMSWLMSKRKPQLLKLTLLSVAGC